MAKQASKARDCNGSSAPCVIYPEPSGDRAMNRYPGFVLALLAAASTADAVVDTAPPCQRAGEWVRADNVQKVELF